MRYFLLVSFSVLPFFTATAFAEEPTHPNILLVLTDDQGFGDVRSHGNPHISTPVQDGLAASGARFERFFVSPVCAPTRAAILTGRYHPRCGVWGVTRTKETMRAEEVTMGEVFRAAGYKTGAFGKWHNGAHYPQHPSGQGFDEFLGFCAGHWNRYFDTTLEDNGQEVKVDGFIIDRLTDRAIDFIRRNKNQPWLCYVPFNTPHSPWQVPDKYWNKYKDIPGLPQEAICAYAMVENIDDNLGRLLATLDELKLADDTIVLFLTDNGANSDRYNAGMRGRKGSLDEGGTRVPLFVRYPKRIKPSTVVQPITAHIDILPTLVELTGIESIPTLPQDGKSLVPLLESKGSAWPKRTLFTRWNGRGAARTDHWRAVSSRGPNRKWTLYDMQADPGQKKDVAKAEPEALKKLVEAYDAWEADVDKAGFDPIPTELGHAEMPTVKLPAHEAILHPQKDGRGIRYHGAPGWAHDWITGWTDPASHADWRVKVVEPGEYRVEIDYACEEANVGAVIEIELAGSKARFTAEEPFESTRVPTQDRIIQGERHNYACTWKRARVGAITLPKTGETDLVLRGVKKTGDALVDVKNVVLTRLPAKKKAKSAPAKPNIVLVMADDQGWGDVGYNGHPTLQTPNLDRMAAAGLRFDRFYAAAPVCSPTRGSVMTGRHPNRFGCFSWGYSLKPEEVTVAESLRRAGYATGHFGKWHLGSVQKGSPVNPGANGFDEWFSAPNFYANHPILSRRGKAVETKGEGSMVTVDAAIDFIRENVKKDRPFFSVVWFGAPHQPHEAFPEDQALYADQPERVRKYLGMITAMDRAIGKLRDELDRLGIRDDTVLWYCSDNGAWKRVGSSGEFRGKKASLYEGGLLVPGIMEWPRRIPKPRHTETRCSTCDIYPTLLEIAGVEISHQPTLDGTSLVPLVEGRKTSREKPMGFWVYPCKGRGTPSKVWMKELLEAQKQGRATTDPSRLAPNNSVIDEGSLAGHATWIDGDWKLHRIPQGEKKPPKFELYDLAADPYETTDLAKKHPDRVKTMAAALVVWMQSVGASSRGEDYEAAPKTLEEAAAWLNSASRRMIHDCRRDMADPKIDALPPQVGCYYEAFWLRDYAYMLEGCADAFTDKQLLDACRLFLDKAAADGSGVDCVKFDGTAIYKPGYGTMGENPVADGGPFTVNVAYLTWKQTGAAELLAKETLAKLEQTLAAVPRNPKTGLVRIDPAKAWDRCPYGFTDTVRKKGDVLFCSLLDVQANRRLAEMFDVAGLKDKAEAYRSRAAKTSDAINRVFWDEERGLYRAATDQCREHDVWGSAFAVFLGVAPEERALRIAKVFRDEYDGIVSRGQLRHLPAGVYWEVAREKDAYQNGAYWATPVGWFVFTLDLVDSKLADQTVIDMVRDFQKRGISEWHFGEMVAIPQGYLASGTLPLAGIRAVLEKR